MKKVVSSIFILAVVMAICFLIPAFLPEWFWQGIVLVMLVVILAAIEAEKESNSKS